MEDQLGHSGPENSEAVGTSPHIADYWQVIARRPWLVMLIFGVTTAAAIWAVSQQLTIYETQLHSNQRPSRRATACSTATATTPRSVRRDVRS